MENKQIIINRPLINYYYKIHPEARYTFLFLHGWRSSAEVWFEMARALYNEGHTSYALDLPGFGKSDLPDKPYTLNDYVEIVKTFIAKLKLENVILVGHSNGGAICAKYATENPELVKKLILINSSGIRTTSTALELKKGVAKLASPFFKPPFMHRIRQELYKMIGADDYIARPELKLTYLNIIKEDLTPFLGQIKIPTLVIWGDHDTVTPLKLGNQFAKSIPDAKLVVLAQAGHYSFIDQPEKCLAEISTFIY